MSTRGKSATLSVVILLGLVFTNFLIQIGVDPSYKSMSTDSGTFAYCGQVIYDGGLMYRDCWDNKTPGVYYLNAAAISLGGATPFAIWIFQAIWLTVSVLAFFLVMKHIWRHTGLAALAGFSLLLIVLYPAIFQGGNFTETYAILPAVLSLGAFWGYLRSGHKRWLAVVGLLAAAGFLLKPTYIAVELAAAIVAAYLALRRRKLKLLISNLAILGISALLPLALVAVYWVVKKDFYELWFAVFVHNISYLQSGFSLASLYGTARLFIIQQPMASLSILEGTAFGVFLFQHGKTIFSRAIPHDGDTDSFTPGLMDTSQAKIWFMSGVFLAIILDVVFLASSGKNFGHYLQVVLPGMVVGMVYLVDFLRRSSVQDFPSRSLKAALLVAVVIVFLSGILEIAAKELPSTTELRAFFTPPGPLVYQTTELEQYIIDHSSPSDSVLVWAGHPAINFVTQRRSPTRYIFLLHLFAPTPYGPNGFNEFLGELKADPPVLIVAQPVSSAGLPYFADPSDPLCKDCDLLVLQGLSDFNQFVTSEYVLNYSIWDWVVYERIH